MHCKTKARQLTNIEGVITSLLMMFIAIINEQLHGQRLMYKPLYQVCTLFYKA